MSKRLESPFSVGATHDAMRGGGRIDAKPLGRNVEGLRIQRCWGAPCHPRWPRLRDFRVIGWSCQTLGSPLDRQKPPEQTRRGGTHHAIGSCLASICSSNTVGRSPSQPPRWCHRWNAPTKGGSTGSLRLRMGRSGWEEGDGQLKSSQNPKVLTKPKDPTPPKTCSSVQSRTNRSYVVFTPRKLFR